MKRRAFLGLLGGGLAYTQAWGRSLPRQLPSMRGGYARGAGESEYPELWRGLVGWWPFGMQGAGGVAYDFSGRGHHGPLSGGVTWEKGVLYFDGTGYINIPVMPELKGASEFSLVFSAGASSYSISCAVSIRNGTTLDSFINYPYDGTGGNGYRIYFSGSANNQNDSNIPADGNLNQFACSQISPTNRDTYVNGVKVTSNGLDRSLSADADFVTIGMWYPTNQVFIGSIDNVALYYRALLPGEIRLLYEIRYAPGVRRRRIFAVKQGIVPPATRVWGSNTD